MADPYMSYYPQQAGHGMPVFMGSRTQKGHGLGSILGGLVKMVAPLAKQALPVIKRQAARTASTIVGDIVRGQPIKKAVKRRAVEAGIGLVDDIISRKSTKRKSIKRPRKNTPVSQRRGIQPNKKVKRDIFD